MSVVCTTWFQEGRFIQICTEDPPFPFLFSMFLKKSTFIILCMKRPTLNMVEHTQKASQIRHSRLVRT